MTIKTSKKLSQLIDDCQICNDRPKNYNEVEITDIHFDSRKVSAGSLFVALTGGSADGHDYIPAAIANGAAAVVGTMDLSLTVPYIKVKDSREALAYLAASFNDHPGRKLTVVGVTGTDGKTTTSNLLFQILKIAGIKAGLVSTVNAVIGDEVIDTGFHVTTPEATEVQQLLAKMVRAGLTHVVLETTSHGLAQHRVTGCEFDVAVVTNITHEHLDYHGSYEGYRSAKARLFALLNETKEKAFGNPRLAVLNADDEVYSYLNEFVKGSKCSYSIKGSGNVNASSIRYSPSGTDFVVEVNKAIVSVHCNLPGAFNVSNCLAAFTAAVEGLGIDAQVAARGIAELPGVSGRMEWIDLGQPFSAIVDFAHTPNALLRAIETARQMTHGRVIAIFGSAGLRDRQKRRMMAETSVKMADITILTAEDPRTESLEDILAEMADEAVKAGGVEGQTFFRVPDRGDAIRLGVKLAQPGDLVMPCGKGHEQSMCFGAVEYPWDDRTALRAALAEYMQVKGPRMPELPTSSR
ncbi:MAG: UDP-N-acetylmuramoyl-L-alanyl-D-glutamate--2,6-diaminopimelate ligase [Anaerolineaceae bacterium]|nr:UDP-N-acetylmuramoyl-L-alanyl-D-glutamate--2,6-diaminopimelate ligase [Anaerolineaceae bacterium]